MEEKSLKDQIIESQQAIEVFRDQEKFLQLLKHYNDPTLKENIGKLKHNYHDLIKAETYKLINLFAELQKSLLPKENGSN